VNQNTESGSFKSDTLSTKTSGPQVTYREEEIHREGCQKTTTNGSSSPTLMKIRDDIWKELGIRFNLSLVDWDKDGSAMKGVNMDNEERIEADSSIIWMSFGAPRDLLISYHSPKIGNTLSNFDTPKFSSYKLNFQSGSLVQMKPPTKEIWDYKVEASVSTQSYVSNFHILVRFMINGELTINDDHEVNFSDEYPSSSTSGTSLCSTISPETSKFKKLRSHWDYQDDNLSTSRRMRLERAQSGPVIIQSSATSSRSFSQAEHGLSIREQLQLIHINQSTHGSEETSGEGSESVYSLPAII